MTGKMRVWPVKSTIRLDIDCWPAVILSPGSSRAQWPVAPNFCSWATRKSLLFFIQIICWAHWISQVSAWAPFNFSYSTALDKAFLFKPWNENDNCPWIDKFLSFLILKMYEDIMGAGGGERQSLIWKWVMRILQPHPWGFSLRKWEGLARPSHFLREIPWG